MTRTRRPRRETRSIAGLQQRVTKLADPEVILSETLDWEHFDPTPLFEAIRERGPAPDAEKTVWAFERALRVARTEGGLVEHLVVASVCLLAYEQGESPRTILEQMFRRSVSDLEWQEKYAQFSR